MGQRLDTIVDREDGPAVVAVLRKDERDRETAAHSHARAQLFASVFGLVTVSTNAGRWVMPPGRAMWIPPRVRHAARIHGPADGWSLYLVPSVCAELPTAPRVLQVTSLLRETIERAATWTPKTRALTPPEERIARVLVDEIHHAASEPLHLPMPHSASLLRIARALLSRPADARTEEEWAHVGGLAKRTLTRRFRTETGMSFGTWRTQLRILVALEQLAAGRDVTNIAFDLGYTSVSAFIATFRRAMGTTPKQYAIGVGKL
ncbi:helix-turn-helix transcriptional regulator [Pendulispora brunnea]|uniref:Helix-turn-helix transcriptional regulator n=1 Tax=Pendulispora brunnea TaxID=2905690 RepID=A0ABZ2K925_9BACT